MTGIRVATVLLAALVLGLYGCSDRDPSGLAPDAPVITSLAPHTVAVGGPAFTLVVTGRNFLADSRVRWAGQDRPTTYVSGTELRAEILAGDISTGGTVQVTVLNPVGRGVESAGHPFQVLSAGLVPGRAGSILSAGSGYSCGVGADGVVYCWGGWPFPGQLTPAGVLSGSGFQRVSVALRDGLFDDDPRGCALDLDGRAYCWGGLIDLQDEPVLVPGGLLFVDLAVGDYHACAVTVDGKVYCWGDGYHGQLGDGRHGMPGGYTVWSDEPVAIHSELSFVAVTSGPEHSCALTSGGLAYCWGSTGRGQLGNGQTRPAGADPDVRPPVAVLGEHMFAALTAGSDHTCGLTITGLAYCWGNGEAGQLGSGGSRSTPAPVTAGHVYTHISAGHEHTCAVREDGQVYCWGRNHLGQLGSGTSTAAQATPAPVAGGGLFAEVTAGRRHTCALTADGVAHCWGYRGFGALGTGAAIYRPVPVPTELSPQAVAISAGLHFHCALDQDGGAWCWGRNGDGISEFFGQLGTGANDGPEWCIQDSWWGWGHRVPCSTRPVRVAAGTRFVALTTGAFHACALTAEGGAYCWGSNRWGQLGDGTTSQRSAPTPVAGDMVFTALVAGHTSTCGLTASGEAHCWGDNEFGQLGNGDTTQRLTPAPVVGDFRFVALAGGGHPWGGQHMCGMDDVGAVYCWGANETGQLGSGSSETCSTWVYPSTRYYPCSRTPLPVGTDLRFATLDAGAGYTCAIQLDGTAYCWGLNYNGQLGSQWTGETCELPGDYVDFACSRMPLPVMGGQRFARISAGSRHTCGIGESGRALCWGSRDMGALGDGVAGEPWSWDPAPTPVAGGLQLVDLASGALHTCGLDTGGAVHCWGAAEYGEAGDGQFGFDPRPMPVVGVGFARPAT